MPGYRLRAVAWVLPPLHLLHRDGGGPADLPPRGPLSGDGSELPRGALFFIHFRRVTRLTLKYFVSAWFHHRCAVKEAIDAISSDLPEEFYIPLSTAYSWLSFVREWCRKRAAELGLDPNGLSSLWDLKQVVEDVVIGVLDREFPRIRPPP
jgi:hypothetical protein